MERLTGMRQSDLDWMRIALVLAAFLLTCARALGLAGREAGMWLWPLFLMVSAGSAWQALFLATGHPPFRARAPVPAGRHSRSGSLSSSPDRPAGRSALWRMEHRLPSRGVRPGLPGVLGTPAAAGDLPAARIVDRLCRPVFGGSGALPASVRSPRSRAHRSAGHGGMGARARLPRHRRCTAFGLRAGPRLPERGCSPLLSPGLAHGPVHRQPARLSARGSGTPCCAWPRSLQSAP